MVRTGNPGEQFIGIWRESKARPGFWIRAILSLGLWVIIIWRQNYIEVTNMTIHQRRGSIFSGNETTMRVDRVTDIGLNQSFLGGVFNYGDVIIQSAGSAEAEIVMHGVGAPRKLRQVLLDLRDGVLDNPI